MMNKRIMNKRWMDVSMFHKGQLSILNMVYTVAESGMDYIWYYPEFRKAASFQILFILTKISNINFILNLYSERNFRTQKITYYGHGALLYWWHFRRNLFTRESFTHQSSAIPILELSALELSKTSNFVCISFSLQYWWIHHRFTCITN